MSVPPESSELSAGHLGLARAAHEREDRAHRHLGLRLHQDLLDDPVLPDLDLDRALVGLDDGHDVAAHHAVARLHLPLDEGARLHVGAQGRHAEFSHGP